MSQSKNGVAAKELQRHLGVTYKCAWRITKQIRLLMSPDGGPLGGLEIIEADETYVGGVRRGKRGRGAEGKTAVFGVTLIQSKAFGRSLSVRSTGLFTPFRRSICRPT